MHLIVLHDRAGSGNPLGVSGNSDRLSFAPYYIFKDLITIFIFILILSIFVFFMPNILGDSENYVMANPMQTPSAIVPEWYLLPFYAILRSIPNKLLGVIAMFSAIVILLYMPFADLSRSRGIQFKPLSKIVFFLFIANFFILMQLGAKHVESPFIEFGQIYTVLYFSHFLLIVPFISLFENSLTDIYNYRSDNDHAVSVSHDDQSDNNYDINIAYNRLVKLQSGLVDPDGWRAITIHACGHETFLLIINGEGKNTSPDMYSSSDSLCPTCNKQGKSDKPNDDDNKKGGSGGSVGNASASPNAVGKQATHSSTSTTKANRIVNIMTVITELLLIALPLIVLLSVTIVMLEGNSPLLCDSPSPWGIYLQDSATPQMEGLVELHDNILFYLVIILFAVGSSSTYIFNIYSVLYAVISKTTINIYNVLYAVINTDIPVPYRNCIITQSCIMHTYLYSCGHSDGWVEEEPGHPSFGNCPYLRHEEHNYSYPCPDCSNQQNKRLESAKTSMLYILVSFITSVICFLLVINLDFLDPLLCDAPRPWGIYLQDSATPPMDGLLELHNNILFYLFIMLFAIGCIIVYSLIKYNTMPSANIDYHVLHKVQSNIFNVICKPKLSNKRGFSTSYKLLAPNDKDSVYEEYHRQQIQEEKDLLDQSRGASHDPIRFGKDMYEEFLGEYGDTPEKRAEYISESTKNVDDVDGVRDLFESAQDDRDEFLANIDSAFVSKEQKKEMMDFYDQYTETVDEHLEKVFKHDEDSDNKKGNDDDDDNGNDGSGSIGNDASSNQSGHNVSSNTNDRSGHIDSDSRNYLSDDNTSVSTQCDATKPLYIYPKQPQAESLVELDDSSLLFIIIKSIAVGWVLVSIFLKYKDVLYPYNGCPLSKHAINKVKILPSNPFNIYSFNLLVFAVLLVIICILCIDVNLHFYKLPGMLLNISYCDAPKPWGIYFQDSATPQMEGLVELHDNILFYLVIILFAVGWTLVSISKVYTNIEAPISHKNLSHGTLIELIWTITPTLILILIAFPSFKLLYLMDEVSDPAMAVLAEGHQWYWSYQYPDFINSDDEFIEFDSYLVPEPDLQDGALRMLEVDNRLIIPELTHVRFIFTGADVIHSYACPALGLKCDAYPGRLNQASVMINREGVFYGQCSEICGILHSSMPTVVQSLSIEKFISWLLEQ